MYCDDSKYGDEFKFGDADARGDVIFCGNPGVGKSTLLSSISGASFKSGVSWDTGLTKECSWKKSKKYPGFRFADTPGLADAEMAQKAAKEITKAFEQSQKEGRNVYLFFVVTIQAGRTNSNDLLTMKLVLESLDMSREDKDNQFGIIVNKVEEMDDEDWDEGEKRLRIRFNTKSSEVMPFTTVNVTFLPKVSKLRNKKNATHHFPYLETFMQTCVAFKTQDIRAIQYRGIVEQMVVMMKKHKEDIESLRKEFENNKEGLLRKLKDAQKAHETEKRKFEAYKNQSSCLVM